MQLVIGNKNYSSWSLRPWLLMKQNDLSFKEQQIWLFSQNMRSQLEAFSPSLKVPALVDSDITVWDSLAICEYINEQHLNNQAWPNATGDRAFARAICAEMHSGFMAVRSEMPMNCRRAPARINLTDQALSEISRLINIFQQCLERKTLSQQDFLFGEFSIADAFFMPIIVRFNSYDIQVPENVKKYMQVMLNLPAYQLWLKQAKAETAVIESEEV